MRISTAETIAWILIIIATTTIGVAIGGISVLTWNGLAWFFDWHIGSIKQGASLLGGLAFVTSVSLCILKKPEGDE